MTFDRRRVLVAEDEYLAALTVVDLLESFGCEVVGPAASIDSLFHSARFEALEAAVLDINIGGTMVWPLADELQRRDVPFLFLSAYSDSGVIPARFAVAPRLGKPLDEDVFLQQMAAMLCLLPGQLFPAGNALPRRPSG